MTAPREAQIFLEPDLRASAEAGQHNFINKLTESLQKARFRVTYADQGAPVTSPYTLSHMTRPVGEKGLLFRRVYHYPFWQIEATQARWDWDVAKARFDPEQVNAQEAARFARFWRKRLFGEIATGRDGYVYVPLQGRLLQQRSFQKCTPIEMIEATLAHSGTRRVVAGLHPKERYAPAEIDALEKLELLNHRFSVARGGMEGLLAGCDYVVTQNSGVAFSGYFLQKPALLFGEIDFHHIAVKADMSDQQGSFKAVEDSDPPYDRYLWWFWQSQSINAGRPEVHDRIKARLRRFGWIE